ncbi:Lactate utilization protein A [Anaerolineales bacterium]|nr:Lactate utilization protein A [Anaerolineales bacterium]
MTTVQLFVTCLVDSFFPQTGEAVVDIFHRLGIRVEFPREQTCCGQPTFNAGLRKDARAIAEHTIKVFEKTEGDIVTPSGSCAHMFRHNYPELFEGDSTWLPRAKSLAARTYEFTEYLVDKLGVTDLGAKWFGKLTYHPSCHTLRGIQVDRQPRVLLSSVKGATLVELPHAEECCGFGGIMSVEHPELSAEWLKRKIQNLEETSAPTLVVTDAGCLMHIAGGLHRRKKTQRVMHIAEVLNHR